MSEATQPRGGTGDALGRRDAFRRCVFRRDELGKDAFGRRDAFGRDAFGRGALGRDVFERRDAFRSCVFRRNAFGTGAFRRGASRRDVFRRGAFGRDVFRMDALGGLFSAFRRDAFTNRPALGSLLMQNLLLGKCLQVTQALSPSPVATVAPDIPSCGSEQGPGLFLPWEYPAPGNGPCDLKPHPLVQAVGMIMEFMELNLKIGLCVVPANAS